MSARLRANRSGLAAFAGLAALVAWRYAGVQVHPPVGRVSALVALAVVAALAMTALPGRRATVACLALLALVVAVALLTAGVPARLLVPGRWASLAGRLGGGLASIDTTLWPYSGNDVWTRIDLTLVLAGALLVAAALAFWPARRLWLARRIAALALLLAAYVLGLLDSDGGSVAVEGLLLLVLIWMWLWRPEIGRRRSAAAVGWLAAAGALAALLAPQLAGGQGWLGYRTWNLLGTTDRRISFSWDQTYGPLPWARSQRTMFTVSAPRSELWKTTTLDRFDGTRFVRSSAAPPGDQDLPLPLNNAWYRFARFTIADLRSRLLPVEQGVTAGVQIADRVDYENDGTVRTARPSLAGGATYTVLSYVPDPAVAELRAAPDALPPGYRRYTEFQLPGEPGSTVTSRDERRIRRSPYGPMYGLAHRIGRGRHTAYDVALAVERYLQANNAYDEHVALRRYPLESFVFADHLGYCQQFSGAMALMLRMDGIPARIAAGFLPGSYDAVARRWVVRAVDAHSWVEVYFSGIGWVPFNPTPARATATPERSLFASRRATEETNRQAIAATVGGHPPAPARASRARRRQAGGGWTGVSVLAIGLLCLLAAAARWTIGCARLRRSLRGDGELATRELVMALRRLGYAIPSTVTLRRVEAIVRLHGGADGARYVRRLRDGRYGPGAGGSATLADRRRLRRALTVRLGVDARLRGLWALPPGTVGWRVGGQPWLRSQASAAANMTSASRAANWTPPSAIAGQPRKLNTRV